MIRVRAKRVDVSVRGDLYGARWLELSRHFPAVLFGELLTTPAGGWRPRGLRNVLGLGELGPARVRCKRDAEHLERAPTGTETVHQLKESQLPTGGLATRSVKLHHLITPSYTSR